MERTSARVGHTSEWLAAYRTANAERLKADPGFERWLSTEYVPIAGGWQY